MRPRAEFIALSIILASVGFSWSGIAQAQAVDASDRRESAAVILQKYADAWRGREELALEEALVLAFWIEGDSGGQYHLVLTGEPGAEIESGVPEQWDLGFELGVEFLRRIDAGEMSALTAMGQATGDDPIPMVPRFGPAFSELADPGLLFRRVVFHFWTRSWPETVPFGEQAARLVHGGNASVLSYDDEFRSAWYQLKPGMHINADARDQTNDFPQLIIITRGEFSARLDGADRVLSEGEAVFIPPGMTHEFWANGDDYGEFVWIAFGEGA